jgi:glycogen operon protein
MEDWHTTEGAPLPLGVIWIDGQQAYNFALYSRHAAAVTLLLYSDRDLVHPVKSVGRKGTPNWLRRR